MQVIKKNTAYNNIHVWGNIWTSDTCTGMSSTHWNPLTGLWIVLSKNIFFTTMFLSDGSGREAPQGIFPRCERVWIAVYWGKQMLRSQWESLDADGDLALYFSAASTTPASDWEQPSECLSLSQRVTFWNHNGIHLPSSQWGFLMGNSFSLDKSYHRKLLLLLTAWEYNLPLLW